MMPNSKKIQFNKNILKANIFKVNIFKVNLKLSLLFILAVAVLVTYLANFPGAFSFQDVSTVEDLSQVSAFELFCGMKNPARVLTNLSYMLNYYTFNNNINSYYLFNVFIHITNSLLVLLLIFKLLTLKVFCESDYDIELDMEGEFFDISISDSSTGKAAEEYKRSALRAAFVSALLFALHPIMLYSVTNIPGRGTLLGSMFYLASVIAFLYYRSAESLEGEKSLPFCIIFAVMALLSKETMSSLPLILFAIDALFFENDKRALRRSAALYLTIFFVLQAVIIIAPWEIFAGDIFTEGIFAEGRGGAYSFSGSLFLWLRMLVFYISIALYPAPDRLAMEYDISSASPFFEPVGMLISFSVIAASVILIYLFGKKSRIIAFIFLWYTLNLFTGLIAPAGRAADLSNCYLPLIAISFCFSYITFTLLKRVPGKSLYLRAATLLLLGVITALSFITVKEGRAFKSKVSLWEDTLITAVENDRALFSLGSASFDKQIYYRAKDCFVRLVKKNDNNAAAHYELANTYHLLKELESSKKHYQRALELDSTLIGAYMGLGKLYFKEKRYQKAIGAYKDALIVDEGHYPANKALAELYFLFGENANSLEHYVKLIELTPDDPYLHFKAAKLYTRLGDGKSALKEYETIIEVDVEFELIDEVSENMKKLIKSDL